MTQKYLKLNMYKSETRDLSKLDLPKYYLFQ